MTHINRQRVYRYMLKHKMAAPGEVILAAVSGGADSMCLLDILQRMDIRVVAAHYNHDLRGGESDRDQEFVGEYCRSCGVPFFTEKGDVSGEAEAGGRGIEETARDMRYDFLQKTAARCGADKIATAHNADDNVETVLMNMSRGAGLDGLCGIPAVRGNIIRPLLCLTRDDIEEYLEQSGVPNIFDRSNDDQSYRRNRIRHSVVSVLKGINPELSMTVLSMTERLSRDRDCLAELANSFAEDLMVMADGEIRVSARSLSELDEAVRARVIRIALGKIGVTGENRPVEAVTSILTGDDPSAMVNLRGGRTVRREYGDIVFSEIPLKRGGVEPVELKPGATVHIPELGLDITCETGRRINGPPGTFHFKYSGICGKLFARSRQPGDKIRLAGRGCTKTVKKLFIEKKIPEYKRDRIPVFSDDDGVVAVLGLGIAERCRPEPGDEILRITVK